MQRASVEEEKKLALSGEQSITRTKGQIILKAIEYHLATGMLYENYIALCKAKTKSLNEFISEPDFFKKLKAGYLVGDVDNQFLDDIKFAAGLFCNIAINAEAIDNDSSRRYFETIAARKLAGKYIKKIDAKFLDSMVDKLKALLKKEDEDLLLDAQQVLNGEKSRLATEAFSLEYGSAIKLIKDHECNLYYSENKEEEQRIALQLVGLFYLSLRCTQLIEGFGQFDEIYHDPEIYGVNRGRIKKQGQIVGSNHAGILKNSDLSFDPNSFFKSASMRWADKFKRDPKASWSKKSLEMGVDPFVSSISGTAMIILNAYFYYVAQETSERELKINKTAFRDIILGGISLLIYLVGGHSFHEFLAPFSLEAVRKKLPQVEDELTSLNVLTAFMDDQDGEDKFLDELLVATIDYLNLVEAKQSEGKALASAFENFMRLVKKAEEKRLKIWQTVQNDPEFQSNVDRNKSLKKSDFNIDPHTFSRKM